MPADPSPQPAPAAVKATISLPMGPLSLNASVQLPTGRTTLTQLLPIIQSIENAIVDRLSEEANAAGTPISCRAGCGACCRQMVPLSLFEAEALTAWFASLPEDRKAVLRQRFHRALSALHDAGILDQILEGGWAFDKQRFTRLGLDYLHAGVPCPFLEDENCSIHPIRPLVCREYLVTSPPALCSDPAAHNVTGVQFPMRFSTTLVAFGQQVAQDRRGSIPLVFLLAWAESGDKPGECFAGTGPEILQRFLDQAYAIANSAQHAAPSPEGS
jgi:Fe-S-cluster containining protein